MDQYDLINKVIHLIMKHLYQYFEFMLVYNDN